jgi:hypothetical protein
MNVHGVTSWTYLAKRDLPFVVVEGELRSDPLRPSIAVRKPYDRITRIPGYPTAVDAMRRAIMESC